MDKNLYDTTLQKLKTYTAELSQRLEGLESENEMLRKLISERAGPAGLASMLKLDP